MIYYHQELFLVRAQAVRSANGLDNGYSFGNDFYQVWLTSRGLLRGRRDLYSPEMTREIQTGLYGRPLDPSRPGDPIDRRVFPYPAFTDLLFWPAAEVPFEVVRSVVACMLALLTSAGVLLWMGTLQWRPAWQWIAVMVLLALSSYPALEGIYAGQLGLLVACLLAATLVALQQHRFLLAGILMGLTTIKPQVTVLVVVYLLLWSLPQWKIRKRFWMGFFATLALLLGTSQLVMPGWIQSWVGTVLAYRHYTTPPLIAEVVTSNLGPQFAAAATAVLSVAAIVTALLLAWQNRVAAYGSRAFWLTFCVLVSITTIVLLPGQAVYDHLILVPAVLVLVRQRRTLQQSSAVARLLVWIGGLVLFWPWIAACALVAVRPWLAPEHFYSNAILALPLRTAASFPFVVLAMVALVWRIIPRTEVNG